MTSAWIRERAKSVRSPGTPRFKISIFGKYFLISLENIGEG